MQKHHQWLAQQLPDWINDDIISSEQAATLRARHPVTHTMGLGRLLITGVGAIMIGLGVILLFAYNWSEMGKYLKLAVIFGALIGAHATAIWAEQRNKVLSESLFALGTMLMGATIFLVGQIYHLDSHYPDAFLLWSLGALALAWAKPSLVQAFMALILVISWHIMEVLDFNFANHAAFLIVLLGLFPLVWRLNSPLLARFVSVGLFVTLGLSIAAVEKDVIGITILLFSVAMISLGQIFQHRDNASHRAIAHEMAKPATLILIIMLMMMTFKGSIYELVRFYFEGSQTSGYFWVALFVSQLSFGWLLFKRQLTLIVSLAELTALLILIPSILIGSLDNLMVVRIYGLLPLLFNLILLALSVWLMADGARHANRSHMVRGSILFTILVMARYVDLFDSLIARAVAFLVVGIALFVVGNIYQRNKRELQS